MLRIFSTLAVVSLVLLVVTMYLGLRIGNYNGPYTELVKLKRTLLRVNGAGEGGSDVSASGHAARYDQLLNQLREAALRAVPHRVVAIFASLVHVLVNSISITYFVGTNRWCREVAEVYSLPDDLVHQGTKLKRRSFPWSVSSIAIVLLTAVLGGAADPGTWRTTTAYWVTPHLAAALVAIAWSAISYAAQAARIHENTQVINQVVQLVHEQRASRGLTT